jgi:hypothetical protein
LTLSYRSDANSTVPIVVLLPFLCLFITVIG